MFWYVLAVQAGMPLPADPVLLIMGASIGDGRYSFGIALVLGVLAALLGDSLWYELGRLRGRSVLGLLCRFALEPDTCVRQAEVSFKKRGAWSLVFAKFVPGLSLISTPLAGAIKMPRWRFLLADAAGATLWCTTYLTVGAVFHKQIETVLVGIGLFGRRAGLVLLGLLLLFIGWRLVQRWRFRWQLRVNRVSPAEAHAMVAGRSPVTVVDLRSEAEVERTGLKIQGAVVMRPSEVRAYFQQFPCEHEVILYCT